MKTEYDALVIGGGPAGSTAATLLAASGWSVALLERSRFPRRKVCGEFISSTTFPLLHRLGVAERFFHGAGPEVRRIGLFSGTFSAAASGNGRRGGWGRALGRESLDTMLLEAARAAGATVWESFQAVELARAGEHSLCKAVRKDPAESAEIRARIVIAAHGSWDPGALPTQNARHPVGPSDLFGFKAHLVDCDLPIDLMPLLAFPDGYGGMVRSDRDRVSLSCCIRWRKLEEIRRKAGQSSAAESVFAYIKDSCRAVRDVVMRATLEGPWLSAGPIRPGIRPRIVDGAFLVGNAAGEAHPVIAEGITMAMQSAALLCDRLIDGRMTGMSADALASAGLDYAAAWRRTFSPRMHAAACVAEWAMRPWAVRCSLPLIATFPGVLTAGARLSGKAA